MLPLLQINFSVQKTENFLEFYDGRIGPWAQFHEAVTVVATAVIRAIYGRNQGTGVAVSSEDSRPLICKFEIASSPDKYYNFTPNLAPLAMNRL